MISRWFICNSLKERNCNIILFISKTRKGSACMRDWRQQLCIIQFSANLPKSSNSQAFEHSFKKILITKYSNSLQFQNIKLWIKVHCFAYYTGANVDKTECNTLVSTDWTPLKDFWNTSVVFFPFTYSKILGDNFKVSLYVWYFVV